jgi:glycosyltransferase involved in cell wall biosynthesis
MKELTLSSGAQAKPLRVMIVTDQYQPMVGGVPTVTRELAGGLAGRGHAVSVVAPSETRQGRRAEDGPGNGITVDYRGAVAWPWYEGQRLGILRPARAAELVAAFEPDVVHVHSPLTLGVAVRSAARRRHVPVVYTNHYLPLNVWPAAARAARRDGGAVSRLRDAGFYAFVAGFANGCDLVTAPTATALRMLRGHGLRAPSQAVSNGVDLDRFSPGQAEESLRSRYGLPAGRPVVLSVGRLSPEKRADVLIAAMARLDGSAGDGRGPVLVLAGAGPDERRLRSLARHYGVADRVVFTGFVPDADLPGLYRAAAVFAIASQAELQSLVTMAAMASGLPVIAVDAGALAELVHAGENGFLARPGGAAAVADCLDLLCRDADLRARMSKASSRIIAGHDRHRLLARWESLYRALAGGADERDGRDSSTGPQAKVIDGQP